MRWPRPRISVRALMAGVLASAVLLGVVLVPARIQRAAVLALRRQGGFVFYDWEIAGLKAGGPLVPPADPFRLRALLGPDFFDTPDAAGFGVMPPDDRLMAEVMKLGRLRSFTLPLATPPVLSAAGMAEVVRLRHLDQLNVGPGGDARGVLPHLALLPELRTLSWRSTVMTDADLAAIGRLGRLQSLNIDGARLSEAGLMHLTGLQELESFIIEGPTPLVDWEARGRFLRAMPNLRFFSLDRRMILRKPFVHYGK